MKELTSYNRAAGYLNKIFDLLNSTYVRFLSAYNEMPNSRCEVDIRLCLPALP